MNREKGTRLPWSDDDLRKLKAVWDEGGWPAVYAAYPYVSKKQLGNRILGRDGTRCIGDLENDARVKRFTAMVTRGGNFDSSGLVSMWITAPRKATA